MREARIHLRHVRDLLKSLDPSDAYNGLDCSSLSFLNVVTQGDIPGNSITISNNLNLHFFLSMAIVGVNITMSHLSDHILHIFFMLRFSSSVARYHKYSIVQDEFCFG